MEIVPEAPGGNQFQNLGGGRMKRGRDFFSHFSWGNKKGGGQLTFYSIFTMGKSMLAAMNC